MDTKKITGKYIFVAAVFVASICILGIKLLYPTPIQIFVGENQTKISQIPGYFTYTDVIFLIILSFIVAATGTYLLLSGLTEESAGKQMLEERKKRWSAASKELKDDERKIFELLLSEEGIVAQSIIVEKTGLSKANVSRALDLLESKGLVERRRRGMGNIVLLK